MEKKCERITYLKKTRNRIIMKRSTNPPKPSPTQWRKPECVAWYSIYVIRFVVQTLYCILYSALSIYYGHILSFLTFFAILDFFDIMTKMTNNEKQKYNKIGDDYKKLTVHFQQILYIVVYVIGNILCSCGKGCNIWDKPLCQLHHFRLSRSSCLLRNLIDVSISR